ncbi:MAG: T9SS type A sorting domain-containing protein [bacterium]
MMKKITFLLAFLIATIGFSQELLTNGDFQDGGSGTPWYSGGDNNPIEIVDQGGNFVFQANVTAVTDVWRVNLSQVVALTDNADYELSFDAFTDATTGTRSMDVSLGQAAAPFATSAAVAPVLTSTPQTFTYTLTASFDTDNGGSGSRLIFDMGDELGFVFIDNVSLQPAAVDPCSNGVQDGDEEGVDCGGSCPNACSTAQPPTVAAPTPPGRPAADVVNVYSAAYAGSKTLTPDTFGVPSNLSTAAEGMVDGDSYWGITYSGGDFMGFNLDTAADASEMTHFHMDYWVVGTPTGGVMNPKWSNHSGGHLTGETNAAIHTFPPAGADGQWHSLDIEITQFNVGEFNGGINPGSNREVLSQLVFGAVGAGAALFDQIYFDNMYFHKNTTLSTEDVALNDFKVFPNPSNNNWNVRSNVEISNIQLFDILGKEVLSLDVNNTEATINASKLNTGIYFARITAAEQTKVVRLIKE